MAGAGNIISTIQRTEAKDFKNEFLELSCDAL